MEKVEVEYVPEKAELDDNHEEFRKIFEKFNFHDIAGSEVKYLSLIFIGKILCHMVIFMIYFVLIQENDKKDETAPAAALSKKSDSDSEEEDQDAQQKEKGGISNKKKKVMLPSEILLLSDWSFG